MAGELGGVVRHLRSRAVRSHSNRQTSQSHRFTATEHRSWMLRLSHENSYLSWTRNAAICAGVGATIVIIEMQYSSIPMADYYAVGFTDLGLVFLTLGSIQHLYSAYRLRKLLQLSMVGYIWILSYTSIFALIYYTLVQSKFNIIPTTDFEEET
jgi:hypothetical protein